MQHDTISEAKKEGKKTKQDENKTRTRREQTVQQSSSPHSLKAPTCLTATGVFGWWRTYESIYLSVVVSGGAPVSSPCWYIPSACLGSLLRVSHRHLQADTSTDVSCAIRLSCGLLHISPNARMVISPYVFQYEMMRIMIYLLHIYRTRAFGYGKRNVSPPL